METKHFVFTTDSQGALEEFLLDALPVEAVAYVNGQTHVWVPEGVHMPPWTAEVTEDGNGGFRLAG